MLRSMSWPQLHEWLHYAEIDPFGEDRADLRAARICSILANIHRPKGAREYSPKDFMPDFEAAARQGPRKPMDRKRWERLKATIAG